MSGKLSEAELKTAFDETLDLDDGPAYRGLDKLRAHIAAVTAERDELLRVIAEAERKSEDVLDELSAVCVPRSDSTSYKHFFSAEIRLCNLSTMLHNAIARAQGEKGDAAEKRERELADIDLINEGDK